MRLRFTPIVLTLARCCDGKAAAGLVLLAVLSAIRPAAADPARFWISMSGTSSSGPTVPTIQRANGKVDTLYIWGQPATVGSGAQGPTNPFKTLKNFSLNLWANSQSSQAVVDFLDSGVLVINPTIGLSKRYEEVHDSTSQQLIMSNKNAAEVAAGMVDSIGQSTPTLRYGLQGYSINTANGLGIGPTCGSDLNCVATASGPAWLIAAVPFKTVFHPELASNSASYFLQVGYTGMNHAGEESAQMSVVLGTGTGPIYTAAILDREITKAGDSADLIVQAIASPPGDYNRDGAVNAADYTVWRNSSGQNGPGLDADGNGDTHVDAADYSLWKMHFGEGVESGSGSQGDTLGDLMTNVPEPSSLFLIAIVCLAACSMRGSCRKP